MYFKRTNLSQQSISILWSVSSLLKSMFPQKKGNGCPQGKTCWKNDQFICHYFYVMMKGMLLIGPVCFGIKVLMLEELIRS